MANEVYYLAVSGAILIAIAVLLPFVQDEFENSKQVVNPGDIDSSILEPSSTINVWAYATSLFKAFVWSFGTFPWYIDTLLLFVRIVFIASIIKLMPTT